MEDVDVSGDRNGGEKDGGSEGTKEEKLEFEVEMVQLPSILSQLPLPEEVNPTNKNSILSIGESFETSSSSDSRQPEANLI